MKIAVDIDVLANDRKTGVYNYDQRLLKALLALDNDNDYALVHLGAPHTLESLGLPAGSATVRRVGWLPRKIFNASLRTPFGIPLDLILGVKADLFVFTKFVRWPLWWRTKSIVFVYDTSFVDYPELVETWYFRRYLNWAVPRSLKTADRVIVLSEHTRDSLVKHYNADKTRISIINPAVDHDVFKPAPAAEIDRVTSKYGISGPYVLSLGTIEPRKNLAGLLRAYAQGSDELRQSHALVLAGGKGWLDGEINQLYNELRARMNIVRTGYVADDDLAGLYSGASVFVFPSLFEGFGMPPLEAMACGTPVIVANNSSLPEVVGDAGILIDAKDPAELARQIQRVTSDPALAQELREKGLVRAKRFQWEQSAQKLLEIINNIGGMA